MSEWKVGDKFRSLVNLHRIRTKGKVYEVVKVDKRNNNELRIHYINDRGHKIFLTNLNTIENISKQINPNFKYYLQAERIINDL